MGNKQIFDKMKSVINEGPDKKSYLGEDDFVEVRYRNIRLSYHVKNELINLARLLGTIRRIMEKLKSMLELELDLIEIEIFQSREEWIEHHTVISEEEIPTWVQGDTGRIIRLVMDQDKVSTFKALQLMVTHECIHQTVRRATNENIPAWLDEGIALYLSQNLPDHYNDILAKAVSADACLPLELLSGPVTRLDRKIKTLAYAQSYSLIEYLVEKYGWEIVKKLLDACKRGDSIDTVLKEYGLNMYLLETEWVKSV